MLPIAASPQADEATRRSSSPGSSRPPPTARYKGRVRTGCLICRARKVKCDEERPTCRKCTRLNKECVYRIPSGWPLPQTPSASDTNPWDGQQTQHVTEPVAETLATQAGTEEHSRPVDCAQARDILQLSPAESVGGLSTRALVYPRTPNESSPNYSLNSVSQGNHSRVSGNDNDRHHQTSQLIYLSTVMDWLAASEPPTPSSFDYFIREVDCPFISPFDQLNWTRVKAYIARVALDQAQVAECLLAVQTVYRAQVDRLPMAHAMSLFHAAAASFEVLVGDDAGDFNVVLVCAFLLCICMATLPNEDGPPASIFDGVFVTRLEAWLMTGSQRPVSLRICAWLQLVNTSAKRPGSAGLLSARAVDLLHDYVRDVPSLSALDGDRHPERSLYDVVAMPVFSFYLKLQSMSDRVVDVTHYRRSRTTPGDQAEVSDLMASLRTDLDVLWEARPAPLQLLPHQLRQHFSMQISDPLIALAGLCIAAFHAETIVIGRILGDRPFPSPEAREALQRIRDIVDGDWNTMTDGALNSGYTRPIFVYALESLQERESQWAADRLRQIKQPCSRSNFLASFVEAHGEAQRAQSRRVTMKYFCYQKFGVPLPFM